MKLDLEYILRPYLLGVSANYYFRGNLNMLSIVDSNYSESESLSRKIWGYMYSEGVSTQQAINQYHAYWAFDFDIKIQSKRDPESMYKVVKMIYTINNYLQSLNLGEYEFVLEAFDVPEGFDIKRWFKRFYDSKVVKGSDPEKELYQYAWGYLKIKSCPKNSEWNKECHMDYKIYVKADTVRDTRGEWLPTTTKKRNADQIKQIAEVAQYFQLYEYGKPSIDERMVSLNKEMKERNQNARYKEEMWTAEHRRKVTPLNKTAYYPEVLKFIEGYKVTGER